jgi:hypothetical protein
MSNININVSKPAYVSKQTLVVYQQSNAPKYPELEVILAPSTDVNKPTYASGRILAKYGSDAPSAGLVGTYVNWDPASAINSQKVPVAIISSEWAQGLTGVDLTTQITATNTINNVNVSPLTIGTTLYKNAVEGANETAIVTAFFTHFVIDDLQTIMYGQTKIQLITIQGVA